MNYDGLIIKDNGDGNFIEVEDGAVFQASKIEINGNHNKVFIGKALAYQSLKINVKGDRKTIDIEASSKYIRNLKVVSIRGDEQRLSIGKNFSCGGFEIQMNDGNEACSIGDDCLFSWGINARTSDGHSVIDLNTNLAVNLPKDIDIGSRVWVGENVYFLKGACISEDSVVASCSVVTKKFDKANCALGGNPASVIKENVSWDYRRPYDYNAANKQPPISLVTVVCQADFRLLELQFSSIEKYAKGLSITEHIVVCNDQGIAEESVLGMAEKSGYQIPVKVIQQNAVLKPNLAVKRGWYTQQVCKLAAHRFCSNDLYLVLDSKNFLISPLKESDIFYGGKPKIYLMQEKRVWGDIITGVCKLFDYPESEVVDFASPSTPFMMTKRLVAEMYSYLADRGESLEEAICDKRHVTEFISYYVYMAKSEKLGLYHLCSFRENPCFTIFRSAEFEPGFLKILESKIKSVKWFGFHLTHYLGSDSEKLDYFKSLVLERKLFDSASNVDEFVEGLRV